MGSIPLTISVHHLRSDQLNRYTRLALGTRMIPARYSRNRVVRAAYKRMELSSGSDM